MKNGHLIIGALALPLLLAGCGKGSSGEQYVGTWTKVSGQGPDVTIAKHDNVFIIKESVPMTNGEYPSFPGEMAADVLVVQSYVPNEHFIIDKTTGHLLRPGEELARASK
jgi:hypothetical protein